MLALAETDSRRNSSQVTAATEEISHQMSSRTKENEERRRTRRKAEVNKEGQQREKRFIAFFFVKGCSCGNLIFKAAISASQVLSVTDEALFSFLLHFSPQSPSKEAFL